MPQLPHSIKLVASGKHTRSGDCVDCHMPKRRTDDVVHVVMTDHYIQRRKPSRDLLAPLNERRETDENAYRGEVDLYYPTTLPEGPDRDLYLAVAQVSQKSNLSKGTRGSGQRNREASSGPHGVLSAPRRRVEKRRPDGQGPSSL